MDILGVIYAPYKVQTTVEFLLGTSGDPDTTLDDPTVATGDAKISKDGGALANTTNDITKANNPVCALVLTATEMEAERIIIRTEDATATEEWPVLYLIIRTKFAPGQIEVNATATAYTKFADDQAVDAWLREMYLTTDGRRGLVFAQPREGYDMTPERIQSLASEWSFLA